MELMILMLPCMLTLGAAFLALFLWASAGGQFEDPEGDKHRIFLDDEPAPGPGKRGACAASPPPAPSRS